MHLTLIQRLFLGARPPGAVIEHEQDLVRPVWSDLEHLQVMDNKHLFGLGLEPVLTTSELAEYLGVHVQAIYDLRTDGRGPSGIRVGREIRYRVSDVLRWLDGLHEPEPSLSGGTGER
ncbi:helix-turn-helix domain-containing protein [Cryobacterium zhongshanensis]|nr:helix-turn-helix domain-containing protein [Cryobacterium zhongshanensis]